MSGHEPIAMSALAADTWHRTLSQSDGRDKLFRLFQYLCKLLRGLDAGRMAPRSDTAAGKVASLETAIATSRQIGRLFKWASVYVKSRNRISTLPSMPALPDLAAILSDAAMFSYYVCDNITFLYKTKLLKGDVGYASRRAARFWLTAVLSGFVGALHKLVVLHRRERRLIRDIAADTRAKKDDGETQSDETAARKIEYASVLREKRMALLLCVKHSADTVVSSNIAFDRKLHPSIAGTCGVLSSIVGFWQVWPRYLPTE